MVSRELLIILSVTGARVQFTTYVIISQITQNLQLILEKVSKNKVEKAPVGLNIFKKMVNVDAHLHIYIGWKVDLKYV